MNSKKIAILGSTGHIGKNLISYFLNNKESELFLFSRDPKKSDLLKHLFRDNSLSFYSYDNFEKNEYDAIINCIGIGKPEEIINSKSMVFKNTVSFDKKLINYLEKFPSSLYINLSSGAVFGQEFSEPVNDSSLSKLDINNLNQGYYYAVSKIYSEAIHRSLPKFNIIDLRIFGFFSRFIDLDSKFFISELANAIKNNKKFLTNKVDIIRDYVHPSDFFSLVEKCILKKNVNDVFDVYSKAPISKFKILDELSQKFDLKFVVKDRISFSSPTGTKEKYYSTSRKAEKIGYHPEFSSLETIINELQIILEENKKTI